MYKRVVIKTLLVSFGAFLIITSVSLYYVFNRYSLDTEKRYRVLVASRDIEEGAIINDSLVGIKTIRESALIKGMVYETGLVTGCKTTGRIKAGDYIRDYYLIEPGNIYKDDERVFILGMDMEERLANQVKKSSYIDIRVLLKNVKSPPKTVLSKIKVDDMVDENGISLTETTGGKKAYAKLILNENQRNRIYIARELGKLTYELYCDTTQKPALEEFQIPQEYSQGNAIDLKAVGASK